MLPNDISTGIVKPRTPKSVNKPMHRSREAGRFQMDNHPSRPGDCGRYPAKEAWNQTSTLDGTVDRSVDCGDLRLASRSQFRSRRSWCLVLSDARDISSGALFGTVNSLEPHIYNFCIRPISNSNFFGCVALYQRWQVCFSHNTAKILFFHARSGSKIRN